MAHGTPTIRATANASTDTATSSSWTPTADALLIAEQFTVKGSGVVKPTMADTGGLTWTELLDETQTTIRHTVYWARAEAAPAARTHTVTSTGANRVVSRVIEITGAQVRLVTGSPNVASDGNASGDPNYTLGTAPAAGSTVIATYGNGSNQSPSSTPGGWTSLENASVDGMHVAFGYDPTQAATTYAWLSAGGNAAGSAVEVDDYIPPGQPTVIRTVGIPSMARAAGLHVPRLAGGMLHG